MWGCKFLKRNNEGKILMKIISGLIRIGSLDEYFAGCGLELSELGGKNTGNPMYTDISLEKLSHSTQQGFLRRKNPT